MLEFLKELDQQLFLFLNSLHVSWLDDPMYFIAGKYNWIPFYMFLTVLIFKKYRYKGFLVMLFVIVLITMSDQLANVLKSSTMRLRPSNDPEIADLVHIVRGHRGGRFGFVSGHAANSFALAIFVIRLLKDRFGWIVPLMLVWACLKSYNRIYLGVHYPGDVLGGALLGILIALALYQLWLFTIKKFFPDPETTKNIR
ncbi:MAG: phosphatase PAP2 family protein [Bacteroidales bacterium]|nr:phosphatase PAP2 family protein [Bacteroidales bacterium]